MRKKEKKKILNVFTKFKNDYLNEDDNSIRLVVGVILFLFFTIVHCVFLFFSIIEIIKGSKNYSWTIAWFISSLFIFVLNFIIFNKLPKKTGFGITTNGIFLLVSLILFIYIIPDDFKSIIIPICSGIISGSITLIGVYITIQHNEKKRNEIELSNKKPKLFIVKNFYSKLKEYQEINLNSSFFEKNGDFNYCFSNVFLKNSSFSFSSLKGFALNKDLFILSDTIDFDKDSYYSLNIRETFFYDEKIYKVSFFISDTLNNDYIVELSYSEETLHNNSFRITIKGIKKYVKYDDTSFKVYTEDNCGG